MSVGSVTARSSRGFTAPASQGSARVLKFPLRGENLRQHRLRVVPGRQVRFDKPSVIQGRVMRARLYREGLARAQNAKARRALVKLALKLVKKKAFGIGSEALLDVLQMVYVKTLDPVGFPGWGLFPAGWTSNAGTVYPGKVIGTYTANGFDNVPNWSSVALNLIDTSDGAPIPGFRYWGHYLSNPLPNGAPGVDWPTKTVSLGVAPRVIYRRLPDLSAPKQARWTSRSNIAVTIGRDVRVSEAIKNNVPPKKANDLKAKPASRFIFGVLKRFANAGGEIKEWTDIFADATGYIKGSMMLPLDLRDTGKETQAKLYWLFVVTGINFLDWEELAVLVLENEVEDRVYGFMGQLSKSAAQSLGMTVGPQTGLVM